MDFHSQKDQDIVVWVTRSLAVEDWTAIREIGVQYDAALVVTTLRPTPQSPANADTFTVWSVSLTSHVVAPLLKGVNLRWLDRMHFADGAPEELAALYDNCGDCAAQTYFTSFYYDMQHHMWTARWLRGGQGIPLWSASLAQGVEWNQVYAVLAEPNGVALVGTWNHFDHGKSEEAGGLRLPLRSGFFQQPGAHPSAERQGSRRHEAAALRLSRYGAGSGARPGLGRYASRS
jgi:hypothetical protein